MPAFCRRVLALLVVVSAPSLISAACAAEMPFVRVSDDKKGFVLEGTGEKFVPWGFNYDHDEQGRLIEDYWEAVARTCAESPAVFFYDLMNEPVDRRRHYEVVARLVRPPRPRHEAAEQGVEKRGPAPGDARMRL